MIYLISQDWANTSNNHAGIMYLCNQLQERYPNEYESIVLSDHIGVNQPKNRVLNKLVYLRAQYLHKREVNRIYAYLASEVSPGDKIILMEYMDLLFRMKDFAYKVKQNFVGANLYAMVHLVPGKLDRLMSSNDDLMNWVKPIDKILTLGTTLTEYFVKRGVNKNKVATTFHYVDEYYHNKSSIEEKEKPTVIAMGNQMRNINLLKTIVDNNLNTNFIICQGMNDMRGIFGGNKNVKLIPFVEESELRHYMAISDISLNVMEDTIGSNVIVTSLAMGLAMICTDCGSIRNYCDNSNTLFCKAEEDYSKAIRILTEDSEMTVSMRKSAAKRAKDLSISRFSEYIKGL